MEAERRDCYLSPTVVFLYQQGTLERAKVSAGSPVNIPQRLKTSDNRTFAAF
jgi:hypothetical protein